MNLHLKGIVKGITPLEQKTEKFSLRYLLIETPGEYPQEVKFQFVNAKASLLDSVTEGQEITVFFDIRGNRYENKVYNNLNGWKIDTGETMDIKKAEPVEVAGDDGLPF